MLYFSGKGCSEFPKKVLILIGILSYNINKSNFDIRITKTDVIWDNENKRGSNIREMFEIIDW